MGFYHKYGIVFRRDEYAQVKSFQRLKMIQHAWIQENARQEVIGAACGKTERLRGLLKDLDLVYRTGYLLKLNRKRK